MIRCLPFRQCRVMAKTALVSSSIVALTLFNGWFMFFAFSPHRHIRTDVASSIRPSRSLNISSVISSRRGQTSNGRNSSSNSKEAIQPVNSPLPSGGSTNKRRIKDPIEPVVTTVPAPSVVSRSPPPGNNRRIKDTVEPAPTSFLPPPLVSPPPSPGVCDVFVGRWLHQKSVPLYTNDTCPYIQPSQNCFRNGRPDKEFLNWKWKPNDCELPALDPGTFLESMRGKGMVFIGDSIARNHMQSLLCALAQVERPVKVYFDTKDKEMKWGFPSHNFTLANLWAPFLVDSEFKDEVYRLQLDVPENVWASQLDSFDVAILSSGYWFFRPSIYHLNGTKLGCNPRANLNCPVFEVLPAYRLAHRQMLKHMKERFKGITVLRTVTVDHFEHGSWNTGGVCNRTSPYMEEEHLDLPWMSNEMYKIQMEEYAEATKDWDKSRLKLLNTTYSSFMRPDGHPGYFRGKEAMQNEPNDCLHWCLPGPIDTWNELLFYILRH